MVQKRVQKPTQAKMSGSAAMVENAMPQYMTKSPRGTGYLFRRGVPADVRSIVGKREFKFTLRGDFRSASQRCRELAVETDREIEAARARLGSQFLQDDKRAQRTAQSAASLKEIRNVTPELIAQIHATVTEEVLSGEKKQRYRRVEAINLVERLVEFERLRRWIQLAKFGDYRAAYGWLEMLTGTLERRGYCLADELRGSEGERELLIEYAIAYGNALNIIEAEYTGEATAAIQSTSPPLSTRTDLTQSTGSMLLSTAIKEFLAHLPPGKRAMNEKHGFILPAFLEVVVKPPRKPEPGGSREFQETESLREEIEIQ